MALYFLLSKQNYIFFASLLKLSVWLIDSWNFKLFCLLRAFFGYNFSFALIVLLYLWK